MKTIIYALFIMAAMITGCNSKSESADAKSTVDAQSTPEGVANMIFDGAKSGDYAKLKGLCDASLDTDVDSKKICELADGDENLKKLFKEYFSNGKIVGAPTIEGDDAKVSILFGPDGTKDETLNMKKKDGKWYLTSY